MLYSTIQFVASLWPEGEDRARYQAAAATFRVPYWDWAATPPKGESVLPRSVWESSLVDVDGPNGVQRISNPLFAYGFKPLVPSDLIQPPVCQTSHLFLTTLTFLWRQWDLWQATFRAPTTDDASAESNNSLVARNLDQNLASIQQRLYTLFSNYANFSTFSNEGWIPNSPNASYDSLESLHDTIHSLAGGPLGGHMGLIPFSAFDPLFYLHHAMVDRIFAMWQALYPDSWVTPTPTRWGTYTIPPGETINSTTALTPFYADSDGTFWNSDTARNPHAFGYTYSEVVSLDLDGRPIDERAQSSLKLTINRLYGSSSPLSLVSDEDSSDEGGPASVEQGGGKADPASTIKPGKSVIVQNKYREWIANIRVERQALGGTFFIHFFLGSVPEDSGSWAHAPTLVGTMSVFASPGQLGMGQHDMDTRGTVPLTAALVHKAMAGVLPGLEAGVVQPYLERNLRFGVIGVNGTVVDDAEVLGLHIQIVSASVQVPPNDEELPIWGPMDTHFDLV